MEQRCSWVVCLAVMPGWRYRSISFMSDLSPRLRSQSYRSLGLDVTSKLPACRLFRRCNWPLNVGIFPGQARNGGTHCLSVGTHHHFGEICPEVSMSGDDVCTVVYTTRVDERRNLGKLDRHGRTGQELKSQSRSNCRFVAPSQVHDVQCAFILCIDVRLPTPQGRECSFPLGWRSSTPLPCMVRTYPATLSTYIGTEKAPNSSAAFAHCESRFY
ncbi:hypothetical protein GE21DRAFT_1349206 [Neurospora crassa]|nr:hypothetical protein B7F21.80 [imported] - Neurospora crassa [Neurospora crassa]KHE85291.1 hypothetical protein GE21DRAFT_1349206 [Neurospora crassa]